MNVATILKQCESVNHHERVARMVRLGQESKSNIQAREAIDKLCKGSLYEQFLSLYTCWGSRDASLARQLLTSTSSKHLKKRAIELICVIGSNNEVFESLELAPEYLQIRIVQKLRDVRVRRRRVKVIESFLTSLEQDEEGKALFRKLLPYGSSELVSKHLPPQFESLTTPEWVQFAKYHPKLVILALGSHEFPDDEDNHRLSNIVQQLATLWMVREETADYALQLVDTVKVEIAGDQFPIQTLCNRRVVEATEILLKQEGPQPFTQRNLPIKQLNHLPSDLFQKLCVKYPIVISQRDLEKAKPGLRLIAYHELNMGWRDDDGIILAQTPTALPTKQRITEARRHLAMKHFDITPSRKSLYIALLPWEEAMPLQEAYLGSNDAGIRGSALVSQIRSAKYDDANVRGALKLVLAKKNDQDPVKAAMLEALSELPRSRWRAEHLNDLTAVARATLDSGDVSSRSLDALFELLSKILSIHPIWAARQLAIAIKERGIDNFGPFKISGAAPVKDVMASVAEALNPFLEQLIRKRDGKKFQNLLTTFGDYVKHWPEFVDGCEFFTTNSLDLNQLGYLERRAQKILRNHFPGRWVQIARSLLANNVSSLTEKSKEVRLEATVQYANRNDQILLEPLFERLLRGFSQEDAVWTVVRAFGKDFWRWTPKLQAMFSQLLISCINNDEAPMKSKMQCVKSLGYISLLDVNPLVALGEVEGAPIQEARLRALGRQDNPSGLPVLTSCLSTPLARIATYSLRSILSMMFRHEAFIFLTSIPQTRVTVAKETLRMIGDLGTEDAYQYLLNKDKEEKLQDEIRLALFRAFWSFLTRPETLEVFRRSTTSTHAETAKAVTTIPNELVTLEFRTHMPGLLFQILSHENAEVRMAALKRLSMVKSPISDPEMLLVDKLLQLIGSGSKDESSTAAKAFLQTHAKANPNLVLDLYRQLISNSAYPCLDRVDTQYKRQASVYGSATGMRPVTRLIMSVLKTDRLSVSRRLRLMFDCLPWNETWPLLVEMVPELHADAMALAHACIETRFSCYGLNEDMGEAERTLRASQDERGRRLALSLLIAEVEMKGKGWGVEQRKSLFGYRADESAMVAEKAWCVLLPDVGDEAEGRPPPGEAGRLGRG